MYGTVITSTLYLISSSVVKQFSLIWCIDDLMHDSVIHTEEAVATAEVDGDSQAEDAKDGKEDKL